MSSLSGCPFCACMSIVRRPNLSLNVLSDATWYGMGHLKCEIALESVGVPALNLDVWSEAVLSEVICSVA